MELSLSEPEHGPRQEAQAGHAAYVREKAKDFPAPRLYHSFKTPGYSSGDPGW
jgi:hypothetical protein